MTVRNIKIYCDSSVNCGCYVIEIDGEPEGPMVTVYPEPVTSNVGEYQSILIALAEAVRRGYKEVEMFTDSLLVVQQVSHTITCRATHLIPLRDSLRARLDNTGFSLTWIPRENNPAGLVLE